MYSVRLHVNMSMSIYQWCNKKKKSIIPTLLYARTGTSLEIVFLLINAAIFSTYRLEYGSLFFPKDLTLNSSSFRGREVECLPCWLSGSPGNYFAWICYNYISFTCFAIHKTSYFIFIFSSPRWGSFVPESWAWSWWSRGLNRNPSNILSRGFLLPNCAIWIDA